MYQIIIDGKAVDYADEITFIRMQENGSYGACQFEECTGFSANSIPYHMEGRESTGMEDLKTASYLVIDAAKKLSQQEERLSALEGAVLAMMGVTENV